MDISALISPTGGDTNLADDENNFGSFSDDSEENATTLVVDGDSQEKKETTTADDKTATVTLIDNKTTRVESTKTTKTVAPAHQVSSKVDVDAAAAAAAAERERDDEGASLLLQLAAGGMSASPSPPPHPVTETVATPTAIPISSTDDVQLNEDVDEIKVIDTTPSPIATTIVNVPAEDIEIEVNTNVDVEKDNDIQIEIEAVHKPELNDTVQLPLDLDHEEDHEAMDIDIDLLERELDAELLEEGEEELVDVTTLTPITTSNSTETEEIDVDSLEESRETVDKTSIVTTSKNEDMIDVTVNESDTETVPIVKEIKLDIELEAKEESAMLSNTMDIEPELVINSKAEIPLSTITMTDDAEEQATIKLEEMPTINSLNGIDSSTSDTTTATKTIGGTKKNKAKRCYCSRERQSALRPMIICHQCQTRFHVDCIPVTHRYWKAIVPGDNFFYFICSDCGGGAGREVFQRVQLTWIEVVHLALFTLSHMSPWKERDPMEDGRVYFATKQDICALIRSRWEQFWLIDLTPIESWEEQVISALKTGCTEERFVSGEAMFGRTGLWALKVSSQFPFTYATSNDIALREPAYNIISSGKLVSLLDEDTQVKVKVLEETPVLDTDRSRKRSDSDDTANKTELTTKYKRMKAESKATKSSSTSSVELSETIAMYPDLDNPGGPVRLSRQPTHTASRVFVSEDGMTTSNEKGYRMAKASHSVFEGAWYYEARFEGDANSNARIGWSQISGDLQGPCGFDYFSYGYRARPGTVFHQSVGRFMGGKGYAEPGDVLGVLLYIPSLNEAEKSDLEGRRWQFGADYEHFRYARPKAVYSPGGIGEGGEQQQQQQHIINQQTISVPDTQLIGESVMPRVQGSELRYYVNGELAGIAFTNIFLGRYYPAISCYMNAKVSVNFGPDFEYLPSVTQLPKGVIPRALTELESETITENALITSKQASTDISEPNAMPLSVSTPSMVVHELSINKITTDNTTNTSVNEMDKAHNNEQLI